MRHADDRLAALWAADEPPAHDAQFVIAVMAAAARRRLAWDLVGLAPFVAAAAAILWALAPTLAAFAARAVVVIGAPAVSATLGAAVLAAWLWTCVEGRQRSLALLGIEDAP
jgi:hypothetical protein